MQPWGWPCSDKHFYKYLISSALLEKCVRYRLGGSGAEGYLISEESLKCYLSTYRNVISRFVNEFAMTD